MSRDVATGRAFGVVANPRLATGLLATLLLALPIAAQKEKDNSFSFDLYTFSQEDDGGNILQSEGFDYLASRVGIKLRLDEEETFRADLTFASIDNALPQTVPATVGNAVSTSASADLTTLDVLFAHDVKRRGSDWAQTKALYYHHQIDNISAGIDLGATRQIDEGNTELSIDYQFRYDFFELFCWDDTKRGTDNRWSNNLLLGWTELLSPSLKSYLGLQYTRQDGLLIETYNFVALHNTSQQPVFLIDERLPNKRNRGQINGRLRYSWAVGDSVGLDASYYRDDWSVEHFAVAPSVELQVFDRLTWRLWYRYSNQHGTRYFRDQPINSTPFRTQDSDLGDFTMRSPGTTLTLHLGETESEVRWTLRMSAFGFERSDDVDGFGGKVGIVLDW